MTQIRAHRRRRRVDLSRSSDRAAILAILVAALLALLIWSPNLGGRAPGDPSAVAADARIARCGGTAADAQYAFTISRASDYARYLPAMGRSPELDLDRPALVIIYLEPLVVAHFSTPAPSGATREPTPTPRPSNVRDVCVYVGVAGEGEINYYTDVSIAGLRASPNGPVLVSGPT
jgi:hypothetical protein